MSTRATRLLCLALALCGLGQPAAASAERFTHPPRLLHVAVKCMHSGPVADRVRLAYKVSFGDVAGTASRYAAHTHVARAKLELLTTGGASLFRHRARRNLPAGVPGRHVRATFHTLLGRAAGRRVLRAGHGAGVCRERARRTQRLVARLDAAQVLVAPPRGSRASIAGVRATTAAAQGAVTTTVGTTDWGGLHSRGTFATMDPRFGVSGLAAGDFNGDGRPDLSVMNRGRVTVHLQAAGGAFPAAQRTSIDEGWPVYFPSSTLGPKQIATGDFNDDAVDDVAVLASQQCGLFPVASCPDEFHVRLHDGVAGGTMAGAGANPAGEYSFAQQTDPETAMVFLGTGEFDSTAGLDLAVMGNAGSAGAALMSLSGNLGANTAQMTFTGTPDARVLQEGQDGFLAGTVMPAAPTPGVVKTSSVAFVGDYDGLGSSLGVTYNAGGRGQWIQGTSEGSWTIGGTEPSIATGDFDNDGAFEVVAAAAADATQGPRLHVLFSGATPGWPPTWWKSGPVQIDLPAGTRPIVASADVDSDGCDDVVVADRGGPNLTVVRSECDGSLTFTPAESFDAGGAAGGLYAGQIHTDTQAADVAVGSGATVTVLDGYARVIPDLLVLTSDSTTMTNEQGGAMGLYDWNGGERWKLTGTLKRFKLADFPGRTGYTKDILGGFEGLLYLDATTITQISEDEAKALRADPATVTPARVASLDQDPAAGGAATVLGRFDTWPSNADYSVTADDAVTVAQYE